MADYRYGKNIVAELSDALVIGYGGVTKDTTSMAYIGGQTGGQLTLNIYAHTAVSIATGEYWYIEFQSFSADTAASAIPPFSTVNGGGAIFNTGTAESDAHMYILHKTSADGQLDFAAGDLIAEFPIPENMCRQLGHTYVQCTNITDKTDPGADETIDVLLCVKPS